jgi:steroid 5-alpha reductase family enzyme
MHIYILSLITILTFTSLLFFVAQYLKNNSIIDVAYGLGFIVTATTLGLFYTSPVGFSLASKILLALIYIWGIRLSYRIYRKNKGKPEDFRYNSWRMEWLKKGKAYFLLRSYFQIFALQGFIISIVLLPFTLSLDSPNDNFVLLGFGLLLWVFGFFFEAVGDYQLDTFIKDKNKTGTIMQTGLWKYTRHPNYFGESTMWWGIAMLAFSSTYSVAAFISPLLITYLLLFVSGIPMLEKKWEGNSEWEEYKKKTSAFIPFLKK